MQDKIFDMLLKEDEFIDSKISSDVEKDEGDGF